MTQLAGDINKTFEYLVVKTTSKTNTAVTRGQVLAFDTDGFAPCSAGDQGPFRVCLETKAAGGAGVQTEFPALVYGVVSVTANGAATNINVGDYVVSDDNGAVKAFVAPDVGATPTQASINAALLDLLEIVGQANQAATTDGAVIQIFLGGR